VRFVRKHYSHTSRTESLQNFEGVRTKTKYSVYKYQYVRTKGWRDLGCSGGSGRGRCLKNRTAQRPGSNAKFAFVTRSGPMRHYTVILMKEESEFEDRWYDFEVCCMARRRGKHGNIGSRTEKEGESCRFHEDEIATTEAPSSPMGVRS
jgi:hypothetical protein